MKVRSVLAVTLVALSGVSSAPGQVVTKNAMNSEGAQRVLDAAVSECQKRRFAACIAVVDDGGNIMALRRLDGIQPASGKVATGKARTSALFNKPTKFFEDVINKGRTAMAGLDDFTPLQGGVPIVVGGQTVGAIGISGTSPPVDEEIAILAAAVLDAPAPPQQPAATGLTPRATCPLPRGEGRAAGLPEVARIDASAVDTAFRTGAVLLDRPQFAIHASRRETPGKAEVHRRETDVIYVVGGSATLVTGGVVVDGSESGPGEIRGRAIDGGDARRVAKGDVIVVPGGVPHWFKEVEGALTYYVVKVRDAAGGGS